jgi:coatomer protein complex subunit gamma
VEDEYQLEDFEIVSADYMLRVAVSNFRNAWENMDPESERVDEYGLGVRESLAEAVNAVINILGMQPCEVSFQFSIFFSEKQLSISPRIIWYFLEHR